MLPRVCWEVFGCRLVAFNNGLHFVYDLLAALARHLGVHADGDHVFVGNAKPWTDEDGIMYMGVIPFLLEESGSSLGLASIY